MKKTSILFMLFTSFYGIQLILALFKIIDAPLIDLSFVTGILVLFSILHIKFEFNKWVAIGIGMGAFLHIIGLYNIIPYSNGYIGTLYGWKVLGYHYDWIVHSVATFFLSLFACNLFYYPLKKGLKSKMLVFIILLFFILGLGAFNEILEYVGFDVFGYGRGFLEFGAGDSSPVEGPWQNASMDMITNLLGGIIGIGGFILNKKSVDS